MNSNLFYLKNIEEIHKGLVEKTIDPLDIANNCINAFEKYDRQFHAWVVFDKKVLLDAANKVKEKIAKGEKLRILDGIPVAVKDIFNTYHFPAEMGSPLWKGHMPGNDARVVYYLKNQGGIVPGKTVTAEFAVHTLNETLNPHDVSKTPGTSSSGSAVSIALGIVPAALGTQTAGSITRPASFCGIYGCKPSFGLIPRTGMLKTTDSLDTVGFFTLHYKDLINLFRIVTVKGPNFPLSYQALNDKNRQCKPSNRPWRVAFAKTHTWQYAPDYAKDSINHWKEKIASDPNIEMSEIKLPALMQRAHEIHATIYNKTLSYYFKEEFKKSELVSPIMNELISLGNQLTAEDYHKALNVQKDLIVEMDNFLKHYDVLFSLTTAGEAPPRMVMEQPDPSLMWTMTHVPVISAPLFTSPCGMPFGAQFVSRIFNDYLLFKFCDYLRSCEIIPEGPNPLLA